MYIIAIFLLIIIMYCRYTTICDYLLTFCFVFLLVWLVGWLAVWLFVYILLRSILNLFVNLVVVYILLCITYCLVIIYFFFSLVIIVNLLFNIYDILLTIKCLKLFLRYLDQTSQLPCCLVLTTGWILSSRNYLRF